VFVWEYKFLLCPDRSACILIKTEKFSFSECCEENFYLCVRLVQNHMEIFSTTVKLFVWRLRLRVKKAQSPHYWHMGGKNLKSVKTIQISGSCAGYWALRWQRHSEITAIKILCSKQAASLFSRCSNAVKNVLFRSFCKPIYASQSWWNFRKSCMQRLCVAYNFGCRALYNLSWRARVSGHHSSGSI